MAYLVQHGYHIVTRNWRCSLGELDLIATLGDQVVFVEVRSRRGHAPPLESITPTKQRRLRALAYAYLSAAECDPPWRIDVIAINVGSDGRVTALEHLEYAVGE